MSIRKAYVDLPEGQLHYRYIAGSEGLPVVFLHQTASSGRMWEKVMVQLTGAHPLYAFDTPGFGGSFDPPGAPGMVEYARWMLEAIDALGLERVHLVGHHTGAAIAIELAARAPDRIATLAMIGPNPLTVEERATFAGKLGAAFRPGRSGAYLLKNWEYLRTGGADADIALLHAEMVDMLRAWAARPHAYAAVWGQDFAALYACIACPMLIMAAPDDILFAFFERARRLRPDAAALVLERGANFEPDLAPGAVAEAIRQHIAQPLRIFASTSER